MKLMAKAPDDRYQSAEEVLAALSNIDTSVDDASETGIVEPSDFYTSTALPANLTILVPTGWFGRLRAKIVDFFGAHAPQVIQQMQTTIV